MVMNENNVFSKCKSRFFLRDYHHRSTPKVRRSARNWPRSQPSALADLLAVAWQSPTVTCAPSPLPTLFMNTYTKAFGVTSILQQSDESSFAHLKFAAVRRSNNLRSHESLRRGCHWATRKTPDDFRENSKFIRSLT